MGSLVGEVVRSRIITYVRIGNEDCCLPERRALAVVVVNNNPGDTYQETIHCREQRSATHVLLQI